MIAIMSAALRACQGPGMEGPMIRTPLAVLLLTAAPALAQSAGYTMHHHPMAAAPGASVPSQTGQGAFAAIQEIVAILEADPDTDWSRVDVEALRQHLIDMANVTLAAKVASAPLADGVAFTVTGEGAVAQSIRRMVTAHAATMAGVAGWRFAAAEREDGAVLSVTVPADDLAKVRALGFIGVMTRGMHHQHHHLMIARGDHPH
jgi:hypothetical protein